MFSQIRALAGSVADSVASAFSPAQEDNQDNSASFEELSAPDVEIPEPSFLWTSILNAPIWQQKKREAEKQLLLESKLMRACSGCKISGTDKGLLHGRFCHESFHKVGMGITLLNAAKASHYSLVGLIRELSLSAVQAYHGYLSPDYFIRAALLAAEHGSYEVVLMFGFEWLMGITDVSLWTEAHHKAYLLYVKKVLGRVFVRSSRASDDELTNLSNKVLERVFVRSYRASDDELTNLSNVDELLSCLLPTKTVHKEVFLRMQPLIDTHLQRDLLHIVGCSESTHGVRMLLINRYEILFHPSIRLAGSDKVMEGLAEKILREGKGYFEVRQRKWLRSAMSEPLIHQFVVKLLMLMKDEIMAERRPFGEKLILRRSLSSATDTTVIQPKRSEEVWGGLLRLRNRLSCCPRISRTERFDADEESALMSLGMDESDF